MGCGWRTRVWTKRSVKTWRISSVCNNSAYVEGCDLSWSFSAIFKFRFPSKMPDIKNTETISRFVALFSCTVALLFVSLCLFANYNHGILHHLEILTVMLGSLTRFGRFSYHSTRSIYPRLKAHYSTSRTLYPGLCAVHQALRKSLRRIASTISTSCCIVK